MLTAIPLFIPVFILSFFYGLVTQYTKTPADWIVSQLDAFMGDFSGDITVRTSLEPKLQALAEEKSKAGEIDECRYEVVGRKGRDYFRRRKLNMTRDLPGAAGDTAMARAKELAAAVTEEFLNGAVDSVYLVYNQFKSVMSQRPVIEPLLPVAAAPASGDAGSSEFLYEPGKGQILDYILPMYVETQIHRALLESVASESGARMTAMENATKSATEMIDRLTLQYNRARQASITKELMEIVGGAEALKG